MVETHAATIYYKYKPLLYAKYVNNIKLIREREREKNFVSLFNFQFSQLNFL